jgi:hypothetical protein
MPKQAVVTNARFGPGHPPAPSAGVLGLGPRPGAVPQPLDLLSGERRVRHRPRAVARLTVRNTRPITKGFTQLRRRPAYGIKIAARHRLPHQVRRLINLHLLLERHWITRLRTRAETRQSCHSPNRAPHDHDAIPRARPQPAPPPIPDPREGPGFPPTVVLEPAISTTPRS